MDRSRAGVGTLNLGGYWDEEPRCEAYRDEGGGGVGYGVERNGWERGEAEGRLEEECDAKAGMKMRSKEDKWMMRS